MARDPSDPGTRELEGLATVAHRIGYARVSTDDQSLDLQRDALRRAGCAVIYEEHASGARSERPELAACRKALRVGDTLVVWRLDRLGRSVSDLVRTVDELGKAGIGFESITEKIETKSAAGALVFHVFAAIAEFERSLTRERTRAGLASARARGRAGGRPAKLTPKEQRAVRRMMRDPNVKPADVMKLYGISKTTLYKYAAPNERESA